MASGRSSSGSSAAASSPGPSSSTSSPTSMLSGPSPAQDGFWGGIPALVNWRRLNDRKLAFERELSQQKLKIESEFCYSEKRRAESRQFGATGFRSDATNLLHFFLPQNFTDSREVRFSQEKMLAHIVHHLLFLPRMITEHL